MAKKTTTQTSGKKKAGTKGVKRTTTKKKSPAAAKSAAKPRKTGKPAEAKAARASNTNPPATKSEPQTTTRKPEVLTVKEIIRKQFDRWQPEALYGAPVDSADAEGYAAPPLVEGDDEAIRPLLKKRFDRPAGGGAASAGSSLRKRFPAWTPEKTFVPAPKSTADYSAPAPAISDEARKLLKKRFDSGTSPAASLGGGDILKRRFGAWRPAALYTPPVPSESGYAAPPFEGLSDAGRALLKKRFTPSGATVAAASPSPGGLLMRRFDRWTPQSLYTPSSAATAATYTAPPFDGLDESEKALLRKDFGAHTAAPSSVPAASAGDVKVLLAKRFDRWQPGQTYTPGQSAKASEYSAKPFDAMNDGVRSLLKKRFDAAAPSPAVQAAPAAQPKPADMPAKAPDRAELLARKFGRWQPTASSAPARADSAATYTAPPFVEAGREDIRELLRRKFDFDFAEIARQAAEARKAAEDKARRAEEAGLEQRRSEARRWIEKQKAVHEKAAADTQEEGTETMDKTLKSLIAAFAVLVALIIAASYANSTKYYLKVDDGVLEVWKGRFAPVGEKMVDRLPGVEAPEPLAKLYTREEVYAIAFGHHLEKADAMLTAEAMPDLVTVKDILEKADDYAVDATMREAVDQRMTRVELMQLFIQADRLMSRGTADAAEAALEYLKTAARLDLTPVQERMVNSRIEMANALVAELPASVEPEVEALKPEAPAPTIEEVPAEEHAETEAHGNSHH